MKIDPKLENSFEDLGDKVTIFDELGDEVVHGIIWSGTPGAKGFQEMFEVLSTDFPGDPDESYYQGMQFTRLIRRKSDDMLFGFSYWADISKHGETFVESNGDEHGYDWETSDNHNYDEDYFPEVYVFQPVTPFTVDGYEVL